MEVGHKYSPRNALLVARCLASVCILEEIIWASELEE